MTAVARVDIRWEFVTRLKLRRKGFDTEGEQCPVLQDTVLATAMSTHDSSANLRRSLDASVGDEFATAPAATISTLLAAAERLTAELAATQIAVQELTAHIARAGLRASEEPAATTAAPAADAAASPADRDDAAALPPRRGDHAVITPASPPAEPQAPARPFLAAAEQPAPYVPPAAPHAAPAPHVAPAPYAAAPFGEAPAPVRASAPGVLGSAPTLPPEAPIRQQAALQHQGPPLERQPGMAEVFDRPPAPAPTVITELSPSAGARPAHEAPPAVRSPFDGPDHASSLADVPLLSAGSVDVLVGPVTSLADLDALQGRILELPGVEAATVTAFEGHDVLMSVDLDRPLPLASMLRTELGRDVASCRLVEGRIVVTFVHRGSAA